MGRAIAGFFLGALRFLVPVALILLSVLGARALLSGRKDPPRVEREARATFVNTVPIESKSRRVTLSAYGTVQAHREVDLQAQVNGLVVEQNESLIRGGVVLAGEVLVRVDPRDYEFAITQEQAALAKAEFDLRLEQGRQVIAGQEWKLLQSSIETNPLSEELALRRPHIKEREAAVRAAQSRLDRAKLDLERTELVAPFNAVVLEDRVEVGQLISNQTVVARLVCIDSFHIEVSIPLRDLTWVRVPGRGSDTGSTVNVLHEVSLRQQVERKGEVVRLLGDVDPTGRMARLLVSVEDPLGVLEGKELDCPLLVGEYLEVQIQGPQVENLVAIPRHSIRSEDRVWVCTKDRKLAIREVEAVFSTSDEVMARNTFEPGDEIITTTLEFAIPGTPLTTSESSEGVTSEATP